jgi:hypothetical protein
MLISPVLVIDPVVCPPMISCVFPVLKVSPTFGEGKSQTWLSPVREAGVSSLNEHEANCSIPGSFPGL